MTKADPQRDCRFFSGYKPCGKNDLCSSACAFKSGATPRILIVHLEALGAVLRATVLLSAVKEKWPESHITWITSPAAAPLLENNSFIDRLLKNDHLGTLALSTLSFDISFCVDKSLAAAGLLRVPVAINEKRGFEVESSTGAIIPSNKEAERLYELGLSNHEKFNVNRKPETHLLIEAMGLNFKRNKYHFEFSEAERVAIEAEKKKFGLSSQKNIIGLNTGCSGVIPHKKLTVDGWLRIITGLQREFPKSPIVLLGGPEDKGRNIEISARAPDVISTPTDRGLRAGFQSVEMCDIVITGDSLGMHMAIALGKYTVAWFGPTCAHEIDFYGKGEAVLSKAPCGPCWKRECSKPVMCYDLVETAEIISAVRRGIKNSDNSKSSRIELENEITTNPT